MRRHCLDFFISFSHRIPDQYMCFVVNKEYLFIATIVLNVRLKLTVMSWDFFQYIYIYNVYFHKDFVFV